MGVFAEPKGISLRSSSSLCSIPGFHPPLTKEGLNGSQLRYQQHGICASRHRGSGQGDETDVSHSWRRSNPCSSAGESLPFPRSLPAKQRWRWKRIKRPHFPQPTRRALLPPLPPEPAAPLFWNRNTDKCAGACGRAEQRSWSAFCLLCRKERFGNPRTKRERPGKQIVSGCGEAAAAGEAQPACGTRRFPPGCSPEGTVCAGPAGSGAGCGRVAVPAGWLPAPAAFPVAKGWQPSEAAAICTTVISFKLGKERSGPEVKQASRDKQCFPSVQVTTVTWCDPKEALWWGMPALLHILQDKGSPN